MHAHLVGAAVPEQSGRFSKAERARLPDAAYRAQRSRYLGVAADTDGERPPDEKKILGHMEKIVASLQFESQAVSALDGPSSGQVTRRRH